ncbi:hypothetical protein OTK49_02650 [Vibrio coralliirubri]|uniref:ADP-ribosyltransferase-containing protein n=1 Tax=Vibrio coralliirubri TaxID=1516159 RepID=UPI00228511CF|nr:hypothetical protein [Vibrio coralliirubri]MCY9861417.1 hypothetical protein [Vibrio coralliirubri]
MSHELATKLSEMFLLPIEVVNNILELDVNEAMEKSTCERMFPSQSYRPNQYQIRLDGHSELPEDMTIQYYDRLKSTELIPSEAEGDIKKHESYTRYLNLSREGSEPPPITVVKHSSGKLISINRRRVLVAQELNKKIGAWVESETVNGGSTLTLGAFNEAKKLILCEKEINLGALTELGFDVSRVWYHGTAVDFDRFELDKFGSNEPKGDYIGKAIFFASDEETALKYALQAGGNKIMKCFLKMSNCLNITDTGLERSFYDGIKPSEILKPSDFEAIKNHPDVNRFAHLFMDQSQRSEYFKSKGYDGFIEEKSKQAAVLSPAQTFILPTDYKLNNKPKSIKFKM